MRRLTPMREAASSETVFKAGMQTTPTSLRGATAKKQSIVRKRTGGLLRCARNDGVSSTCHSHLVPQHKARPARFSNAVAEVIGLCPRVGAEAHLVEQRRP